MDLSGAPWGLRPLEPTSSTPSEDPPYPTARRDDGEGGTGHLPHRRSPWTGQPPVSTAVVDLHLSGLTTDVLEGPRVDGSVDTGSGGTTTLVEGTHWKGPTSPA